MAKSNANIFMMQASGTVGRQMTLSRKAGDTILGKKRGSSTVPATEDQLTVQKRFKRASIYAVAAIKDPITRAAYEKAAKPGQSAYNVALADAARSPVINSVDITKYNGNPDDTITIDATDNFKVVQVSVVILSPAGVILEQGDAGTAENNVDWVYTATVLNNMIPGSKIIVTARDLPANETVKEVVLN